MGVLRLPAFLSSVAILFCSQFVERSFFLVIPLAVALLLGRDEGIGTATGLILGVGALTAALSATVYGRLARTRSIDQLLGIALGGGAVLTAPIALVSTVWALAALRVAQALISAGATTLAYARAGRQLPASRGALGYAMLTSGSMLGAAFAPMLVGVLAGFSLPLVFVVDALLCGLGFLILLRTRRGRPEPPPDATPPPKRE
jgi:MFS family permease